MAVLLATENLLPGEGNELELPVADVATTMKFPNANGLVVKLRVAEVPLGSIVAVDATIAGGANAGTMENVEPNRSAPVTVTVVVVFVNAL
jgi:hypothetical protein